MVDTIKFTQFPDGGDISTADVTVGVRFGDNTRFNNPWNFLPSGATGDRPPVTPEIYYRLRFNTTTRAYEFYDPISMSWVQLIDSLSGDGPYFVAHPIVGVPSAIDFGSLGDGIIKQTVLAGVSTPAIAVLDTDYYGPGMVGYLRAPVGVQDANGNTVLNFMSTPLATTNLAIQSVITGLYPNLRSQGPNADIGMNLIAKGIGTITIQSLSAVPIAFYSGTAYQHVTSFNFANTAANRTVTFQDASGTVAYLTDVAAATTTIIGTNNQIIASNPTGVVTLSTPQNIAPASSPTFDNLTLTTSLTAPIVRDVNGNTVVAFVGVAPAANYLAFSNAILASAPKIFSVGPNADLGITFQTKGLGSFVFSSISNQPITFYSGTAFQHLTTFQFFDTPANRTVVFQDSDGTVAYLTDIPAAGVASVTGTANRITSTGGLNPQIDIAATYVGQTSITTLGTIGTGTWHGALIDGQYGGTGVNNTGRTITLGGNLVTTGNFTATFNMTAATNVTFPIAGTLQTTAGASGIITGGTINQLAYYSAGTTLSGLAIVNSAGLTTTAAGVPTWVAATGTGAPVFATSPTITTPIITQINDTNGVAMLNFVTVASAVNNLQINNSTVTPVMRAIGASADVGITFLTKGAGFFTLQTAALTTPLSIASGTASQHSTSFAFANTAAARTVTFQDANGTVAYLSDVNATVTSITGTANQVIASVATGAVTLSLPQNIATTSNVTFNSLTSTADSTIHGVNVGLGAGSVSTNISLGGLGANTTGSHNISIGFQALNTNLTGSDNTAVGYQAARLSTVSFTTAIGSGALAVNTTGTENTAVGYQVLSSNQTGIRNTCVGYLAGSSMTGSNLTAVGYSAAFACTGTNNTAVGRSAFAGNTTGISNAAFGFAALSSAGTFQQSTAIGSNSLEANTGSNNTAVGYSSLANVTSGTGNVALGDTTGLTIGSGVALTTGSGNTLLGKGSGVNASDATGCISLGQSAVSQKATGVTSSDNGPGISVGSATFLVGFRGDGTVYPTASVGTGTLPLTFTGYWRVRINGTFYKIPLYVD